MALADFFNHPTTEAIAATLNFAGTAYLGWVGYQTIRPRQTIDDLAETSGNQRWQRWKSDIRTHEQTKLVELTAQEATRVIRAFTLIGAGFLLQMLGAITEALCI